MTPTATKVSRALLALFTAFVLVVTFYPAALGLGYALDASADFQSRVGGALFFLPSVALLVLLVGMLPPIRGRMLLWLGVTGSLLPLPSIIASLMLNSAAAFGALVGLLYLGTWWLLAWPKVLPIRLPLEESLSS